MSTEHTKTPWKLKRHKFAGSNYAGPAGLIIYIKKDEQIIAEIDTRIGECPDEYDANAAFIVTACNSHDELVAVIQRLIAWHENPNVPDDVYVWSDARTALKNAGGKS